MAMGQGAGPHGGGTKRVTAVTPCLAPGSLRAAAAAADLRLCPAGCGKEMCLSGDMEEERAAHRRSTREWSTPAAHEADDMSAASPRGEEQAVPARQFFSMAFNW